MAESESSGLAVGRTTRSMGAAGEATALAHLQAAGLKLVARNFKSPGRGGGEVDLIMREPDGTLVFVEVRQRAHAAFGGAAASVGWAKQRRVIFAARHYLQRLSSLPPCRFDVVALQGALDAPGVSGGGRAGEGLPTQGDGLAVQWIRGAFDASGYS
jgi:putative endonuclease